MIIQPVENVGGALSKYADTSKIREERDAWEKAAVKKTWSESTHKSKIFTFDGKLRKVIETLPI